MVLDVPDLRDGDIVLRPPETRDVDQITAACQDPAIPRYTRVPTPYTRADGEAFVSTSAADRAAGTALSFVITEAEDDQVVLGAIGVHRVTDDRKVAEVGYWIEPSARRRGIASRALVLVGRWAVTDLGVQRLELLAASDNVASQEVAERAGFTREGVLRSYFDHRRGLLDVAMYSLLPIDLS
jgi:RimJ/RimL family protein N-acetyltransferase